MILKRLNKALRALREGQCSRGAGQITKGAGQGSHGAGQDSRDTANKEQSNEQPKKKTKK
jgi:hypothetical protein